LGLESFAVLSDGSRIENPRYLKKSEEKLKSIQSRYSKYMGKATKGKLSALHRKVNNQRNDFLHKASTMVVNKYGLIGYEDLNIKEMTQGQFSKSIYDAGWGKFTDMIKYKAESAGTYAIAVIPETHLKFALGVEGL
jgi:putative transposase